MYKHSQTIRLIDIKKKAPLTGKYETKSFKTMNTCEHSNGEEISQMKERKKI